MSMEYNKRHDGMGFELGNWNVERNSNDDSVTVFAQNYEDNRECFVTVENKEVTKVTTTKGDELPIDYIPSYLKKYIISYNNWASKKGF